VTFDIPKTIGKLADLQAEFSITFSTADASGADIAVVPSPFFVSAYEILYDGAVMETVEATESFRESLQWVDDQTASLASASWNLNPSTGGFVSAFNLANASATSARTWYLPLNSNHLLHMSPFVKGIDTQFSIHQH
jgi:hypothetical protein